MALSETVMATVETRSFCLVQGQLQNSISVADRGFAYGDGVFETMRVLNGRIPGWAMHWQRLSAGCQRLRISVSEADIADQLGLALALVDERDDDSHLDDKARSVRSVGQGHGHQGELAGGVLKLMVTRGVGGSGYISDPESQPTIVIAYRPYRSLPLDKSGGVRLVSCLHKLSRNPALAGMKHLNRLEHVLAGLSVDLQPGEQGLLFDVQDNLIEALHHNLFLVKEGVVRTADLYNCGVEGVLRRIILEQLAVAAGVQAVVEPLRQSDLESADEVFICNAVHGVSPVTAFERFRWQRGPVTQLFQQALAEQWNFPYDR